jgi:AcrR family transcriptional regulator
VSSSAIARPTHSRVFRLALMGVKSYSDEVTSSRVLADVRRRATVDHIVTAARDHVLANGLDATMDELAEAAEVSRRTLFRLFATREQLLAAAFDAGMASYVESLPRFDGDRDDWLRAACDALHRMNANAGPGFFELSSRRDLSADLARAERDRRRVFRGLMSTIATTLWRSSGEAGEPPDVLLATVTTHLSPFFTAAVTTDAGRHWRDASDLAYDAITATLLRLATIEPATAR